MPRNLSHLKVLIVDDHATARELVANAVREHNVQNITMAPDGTKAREAIYVAHAEKKPFDVVFLDWDMPEMAGIDVLKHFREQPQYADTAFIMVTANADKAHVLEAIKAGATTYIIKPVSRENIAKKFVEVSEWLKMHRLMKSANHPGLKK